MNAACAVCHEVLAQPPPKGTLALSSGECVCADPKCQSLVTPCTYCNWTGILHQAVYECTGPFCKEAICQLCEESFENNTFDRNDRICDHAVYGDQ